MKLIFLIIISLALIQCNKSDNSISPQIDEGFFPVKDPYFEAYLVLYQYDDILDYKISKKNALKIYSIPQAGVTEVRMSDKIQSFEGIENFINLEYFKIPQNSNLQLVSSINFEKNSNIKIIDLQNAVNISTCKLPTKSKLEWLFLTNLKKLASLELSNQTKLNSLFCQSTGLKSFDLKNNILLETFNCDGNLMSNLNLEKNVNLTNLYCRNNLFTTLNLSTNVKLSDVDARYNPLLKTICTSHLGLSEGWLHDINVIVNQCK